MEELLKILRDIRDDVDFENETKLVDGKILTSFDIIQIIGAIDDEYDIAIPAPQIVPANFNSAEAILALIEKLKG
ncbi:MAG: acyl carrier protein [Lachnospiraceae bacterium]|nr:acyl carrier protein [Lachnospiraceae bacterium]